MIDDDDDKWSTNDQNRIKKDQKMIENDQERIENDQEMIEKWSGNDDIVRSVVLLTISSSSSSSSSSSRPRGGPHGAHDDHDDDNLWYFVHHQNPLFWVIFGSFLIDSCLIFLDLIYKSRRFKLRFFQRCRFLLENGPLGPMEARPTCSKMIKKWSRMIKKWSRIIKKWSRMIKNPMGPS